MVRGIALDKINSWDDFKSYAEAMPNTKSMGDAFEHLTKLYFQINPLYTSLYDNVWLLEEVPSKVLEQLEIPRQDLGIDLILQRGSEYHAIQCKYHSNKDTSVNNKEVATFTSLLANKKKLTHGYICSTAIKTSANYNKLDIQNISNVLYDTWSSLDKDFFNNARGILDKKKPNKKPFTPKPHQENAIKLAHKHFVKENNSRGKLIFPCGSGKSLTGFWMMEKLKANSTLVAVPSLSLVKQTLEVYLKQVVAKNKRVKWLCICSDEGIGKSDDVATYTRDLPVPCTTDPVYIKEWLKSNKDENIIIFTTYQSGRLIAEISKALKFTFDLGVYDEAHKTVGKNENLFSYLLFEENISVKHRIFMTATERFYRGLRDDVLTMDDPDDYGEVFCHMSFKEAIEEDLLTDYKIITIEVKKEEIAEFIKDNNLVKSNAKWGKENEARSLASMIALRKAMKTLPIKNAVSFHSSIERATRNKEVQKHITESYGYKPIDAYHVSGKLPTTKRNDIVQEFAKSDRALITNSRCLTEGVDVPNIDCIVFADPRKSKVDIVQALGRALRKKPGKDWGYVVLPVVYDHKTHEIDNDNFQEILNIVRGLAANDERIIEYFKDINKTGVGPKISPGGGFTIDQILLKEGDIADNLSIKLWNGLSKFRFNWLPYNEAKSFVQKKKFTGQADFFNYLKGKTRNIAIPSDPPRVYSLDWVSWGDFLGTGTIATRERKFFDFKEGRKYVRSLNLKSNKEWRWFCSSGRKPNNLPSNPQYSYKKDWISWGDFLGTGVIKAGGIDYLKFSSAREVARSLNLKSTKEWRIYSKSEIKPFNMPANPNIVYKDSWISWGDFLGTNNVHGSKRKYLSYDESKKFVAKLKLKNEREWREYFKQNKPKGIPFSPDIKYKEKWTSYLDWLSTGKKFLRRNNRKILDFENAKDLVRSLNIKSSTQWKEFCKSGKRPPNIPSNPNSYYRDNWISWGDFLGTGRVADGKQEWISYQGFKEFVKSKKIKSKNEWIDYIKSNDLPTNIPRYPEGVYKRKGEWKGYNDVFLKSNIFSPYSEAKKWAYENNILTRESWINSEKRPKNLPKYPERNLEYKREWEGWDIFLQKKSRYLPFRKAKKIIHNLNLKDQLEWREFCKSTDFPNFIPKKPDRFYKNSGWIGLGDWLGTGNIASQKRSFVSFKEAKKFAKERGIKTSTQWFEILKGNNKPDNIPYKPSRTYKDQWKGWSDFLGKED
ncbi:DEAD/DEAH box helicase family protein [Flavobacteriaceae bacterium]|nr:DEAD/DEAH box helicase family protein [Flavobacteriaceae bacterium]